MEKLNDLVSNSTFVDQMNTAFSSTRSDFKITKANEDKEIEKLSKLHVDVNGDLSSLVSKAVVSSGAISGLRGTGKTHLFLLARNEINKKIETNRTLCIYLNLKELSSNSCDDEEMINRKFSVNLYKEIANHIESMFLKKSFSKYGLFDFKERREEKQQKEKLAQVIQLLAEYKMISKIGDLSIDNPSIIKEQTEKTKEETIQVGNNLTSGLSSNGLVNIDASFYSEEAQKGIDKVINESGFLNFLDISNVKDNIINILTILDLNRITFFIDDWEKIFDEGDLLQKTISTYLDKINDNPIFIWLGVVPGRCKLFKLNQGSDLQHYIDLDKNLIFEESFEDKKNCLNYFRDFINKRLSYYITDYSLNYNVLLKKENFEMLVHASMGNSRDFANMLSNGWSTYNSKIGAGRGRRFATISQTMVIDAIKHVGKQKLSNIKDHDEARALWSDIKKFCIQKQYSHFSIIESHQNQEAINSFNFQELIYNRLVHFRKQGVATKDGTGEDLSIYALNYGAIYDLMKLGDRKITFVLDSDTIHNKIRRYIYNPIAILEEISIKDGGKYKCNCCGRLIDTTVMKAAWEANSCPFQGGKIRT